MHKWFKLIAIGMVAVGLVLAVAAVWLARAPSAPVAVSAPHDRAPAQQMLVAQRALSAGTVLGAEDVAVVAVAQRPAGALEDASAALGRSLAQPLMAGALVRASDLLSGLSGVLQTGERAVAVKVEESSAVGHRLQPGDWVDAWVVLRRDGQEVGETQARLLLERTRVLAYGAQLEAAAASAQKGGRNPAEASVPDVARNAQLPRTAVLAVPASEAAALLLAERQGQVLLVLRPPLEARQQGAPAALPAAVLASLSHTAAAAPTAVPAMAVVRVSSSLPTPQRAARPSSAARVELVRGSRSEVLEY